MSERGIGKRIVGVVLVLLASTAVGAVVLPRPAQAATAGLVVGVLERVDPAARQLWLSDQQLPVAPGAEIVLPNGSRGSLYELKPGMRLRCRLEARGGSYRVTAVTVLPEGAPLLPPPPPELLRRLEEVRQ